LAEKKPAKSSNIGTCEKCGKLVVFTKYTLCYDCRRDEKVQVDKAMEYLKTHRGATLQMVAEATGVDPKIVLRLIRGGRLEVSEKDRKERKNKR
jgi:hypothetical protein